MRLDPEAAICKYDELMLSAKELLMDERAHSLDKTAIACGLPATMPWQHSARRGMPIPHDPHFHECFHLIAGMVPAG